MANDSDMTQKIAAICRNHLDMELSDRILAAFQQIVSELLKWNRKINLTSITRPDDVMIKHIVDSLYLIPHLKEKSTVLDIGSGAGFPAVIVALLKSSCSVVSVDAVAKKIHFQRNQARVLNLANLDAKHSRVEDMVAEYGGRFDSITSRAFSSIETFVTLAEPLLAEDGVIIAMKGRGGVNEADSAAKFLEQKKLWISKIIEYDLPDNAGERKLIFIERK